MITTNIIHRVFHLRNDGGYATGFTVEFEKNQYLLTASHFLKEAYFKDRLEIARAGNWLPLNADLIFSGDDSLDFAIYKLKEDLSPRYPTDFTLTGVILGQPIYYLGFPLATDGGLPEVNRGFPLPLIKSGIISAVSYLGDSSIVVFDGFLNKGFSGGPLIINPLTRPNDMQIIGIVSAYRTIRSKVFSGESKTEFYVEEHTGLSIATNIDKAMEIIKG